MKFYKFEVIKLGSKFDRMKEKLISELELPEDIALNLPKITVIAKKEITIENHKGIIKFDEREIIVNTPLGAIKIWGENLIIIFVGGNTITISGIFKAIVYEDYEETR